MNRIPCKCKACHAIARSATADGLDIIPATRKAGPGRLEDVMKKFAWLLLFSGVVGLSLSLHAQQTGADLILFNGKIITVNDTFQIAQAVAVRGSRIVAVGSNADVTKLAGPNTQRIDLRGKSMVPGFIDNH